jgi:hypothetical protein
VGGSNGHFLCYIEPKPVRIRFSVIVIVLASTTLRSALPAEPPLEAQVEIAVMQQQPAGRLKVLEGTKNIGPNPGDHLQVWLSASAPCNALIVAFNVTGGVAYPDQPLLVSLKAAEEQDLPAGDGWKWDANGRVKEMDVLLLDPHAPANARLAQLVNAMRANVSPAVRTRQVGELHRIIDSLTQRDAASAEFSLKSEPVLLAGLVRGMSCSWCGSAPKIKIPAAGSCLVRHRFQ